MKKRRILVMMHEDLVPPDDLTSLSEQDLRAVKTEADVVTALKRAGHEVVKLGLRDELRPIRQAISETKPHIVFNLLEEFRDLPSYDFAVVSYLELVGLAYTGCSPRGLVLARDKALSKQILSHHKVHVPRFAVFQKGRRVRRPKKLEFPLIVKTLDEEGSVGISQASLVRSDEKLVERVQFVHEKFGAHAIAEEFIEGRELYASVIGNKVLTVFPTWELIFENLPEDAPLINTEKAKWDPTYQKKWGIDHGPAELPKEEEHRLAKTAKRIYRTLSLSGYARIDFRLRADGRLYFLEANPNPDIAKEEEFAWAAKTAKLGYTRLLEKIVSLGLGRRKKYTS